MKRVLFSVLVVAALGTQAQQVFHDPEAEVREVGSFHAVEVGSAIELQLTQGNADQVAVSAGNKDDVQAIKTEVRGGVLKIFVENKRWFGNHGGRLRAYVSARSLDGIEGSGATNIRINGALSSNSLAIRLSGASDLKGTIKAQQLDIDLSGASDLDLNGSATDAKIEASGASQFKAFDFAVDNCQVKASGASAIKLTANKSINAEASGASSISYQGSGQAGNIRTSGASSISRKG